MPLLSLRPRRALSAMPVTALTREAGYPLLSRHGGWVLLFIGLALVAIGVGYEERAAVAVPLVVLGSGLLLVGVLVEQIEGDVELSVNRVKLPLIRRVLTEEGEKRGLPPEEVETRIVQISQDLDAVLQSHHRQQPGRSTLARLLTEKRAESSTEVQGEANEWEAARRVIAAWLDSIDGPSGATGGQQKAQEQQQARRSQVRPKTLD